MEYKRLFFPLGGGGELRQRIHGALLIGKYFESHLEIFKAQAKPSKIIRFDDSLPEKVLKELNAMAKDRLDEDLVIHERILDEELQHIDVIKSDKRIDNKPTVNIITGEGYRSELIELESKYCDLVVLSSPHDGRITSTFETTITKSGKPALMFPREMKSFSTDKIIIGWNNSPEIARSVTRAIPILKNAKEVHIITSKEYTKDISYMTKLQTYLEDHGIKTTYDIVETTSTPGEALLYNARKGNYDLIIAGAFGHKGLREIMFGGTTKYILEHADIPIFMTH